MKEEVKVAIEQMRDHAASFREHLGPEARAFGELISLVCDTAERGIEDTARIDFLQRDCDRASDGRIMLRAAPGMLRYYIDASRNPRPLGQEGKS